VLLFPLTDHRAAGREEAVHTAIEATAMNPKIEVAALRKQLRFADSSSSRTSTSPSSRARVVALIGPSGSGKSTCCAASTCW
jgi:flagellar biosynthesis GTPase FlhF